MKRYLKKMIENHLKIYLSMKRKYVPRSTSMGVVSKIGTTARRILSGLRTTWMSLRNKTCPSFLTPAPIFITIKGFNIVKLGEFINVLYQIILFWLNYSANNIMFIVLLVVLICLCNYSIKFSSALSLKSLLPSILLSLCFSFFRLTVVSTGKAV